MRLKKLQQVGAAIRTELAERPPLENLRAKVADRRKELEEKKVVVEMKRQMINDT